jgi:hypothetical protein
VAGCREEGVSRFPIEKEALLVSWFAVNVSVPLLKETRFPPFSVNDRPFSTGKGRERMTVYVTPKSKGSEKRAV